jgi:hypothetical protein
MKLGSPITGHRWGGQRGASALRTLGIAALVVVGTGAAMVPGVALGASSAGAAVTTCGSGLPSSGSALATGVLNPGQCLTSPSGRYQLIMQSDGNLVLYDVSSGGSTWSSNTANNPGAFLEFEGSALGVANPANTQWLFYVPNSSSTPNPALVLQDDGNLVLYAYGAGGGSPSAVWSTGTQNAGTCTASSPSLTTSGLGSGGCLTSPNHEYEMRMQSDGNLVLYFQAQADALWAAFPSGPPAGVAGDTLVLYSDGNLCVEGWCNNASAPNATLVVQNDGNLVEYGQNPGGSSYAVWATNTNNMRGFQLQSGQLLQPGQSLLSSNGQYQLAMSATGTLVLAQLGAYACPMWTMPAEIDYGPSENLNGGTTLATTYSPQNVSFTYSTSGAPIYPDNPKGLVAAAPTPNAYLAMQTDGNLVLYPQGVGVPALWATGTNGNAGAVTTLQTDGNIVVTSATGAVLWASGTSSFRGSALCTNGTLQEGQYLKITGVNGSSPFLTMQGDCNLVLYVPNPNGGNSAIWASNTGVGEGGGPKSGPTTGCFVAMQDDGNLVVYQYGGGPALWASNTAIGEQPPTGHPYVGPFWLQLFNPYAVVQRWGVGTAWKADPEGQISGVNANANSNAIAGDVIAGINSALTNNFFSATSNNIQTIADSFDFL